MMRFGISMEDAALIHIGDAGNIASGMFELAAQILGRDQYQVMKIGGVWKFEAEHCQTFFDKAKEAQLINKDTSMFWSSMIHASTHNSYVRISFFEPCYETGYLEDALEQMRRDVSDANQTEMRLKQAAHVAQKEREAAQRHVDRLHTLLEVRKNESL